jgi:hypothetical protein
MNCHRVKSVAPSYLMILGHFSVIVVKHQMHGAVLIVWVYQERRVMAYLLTMVTVAVSIGSVIVVISQSCLTMLMKLQ